MEPIRITVTEEPGPSSARSSIDSLLYAADGSSYYDEDETVFPVSSCQLEAELLCVGDKPVRLAISQPVTPVKAVRDSLIVVQPDGHHVKTLSLPCSDLRASSAPEISRSPCSNRDAAMPFNLRLLLKLNFLSLNSEWVSGTHTKGTYRYLHYAAYGANQKKELEGDIECCYDSCFGCCLSCVATEVTVHVRNSAGSQLFRIQLTGELGQEPLDTADIVTADGVIIARISWDSPYFTVVDSTGLPLLKMKLQRFLICTLNMCHKVLDGQSGQVLGTIDATFTMFAPTWSNGYSLLSHIHPQLDLKRRVAWIALMFILKLTHRGREYAKVIRVD